MNSTIFAPISSVATSAITVIRISGEKTLACLQAIGINNLKPRFASLKNIIIDEQIIDQALVVFFNSPHSFTGEDVAEISIHSSVFILQKITSVLLQIDGVFLAQAGEFSKRAFLNGKLDLVQIEAIPDLIASETALQHKQAMSQLSGKISSVYHRWRQQLIETTSLLTAIIDFPEDDLPQQLQEQINQQVQSLHQQISSNLNDNLVAQKIRQGFSLAIVGAPNAGKSSLLNYLANSDIAIVSPFAGTTRDVIETHLQIGGVLVVVADTAGIRHSKNSIEQLGISKARTKAKNADLKILMLDATKPIMPTDLLDKQTLVLINKIDQQQSPKLQAIIADLQAKNIDFINISLTAQLNLSEFKQKLNNKVQSLIPVQHHLVVTNERYRLALHEAVSYLQDFSLFPYPELAFENLRLASKCIGRITGEIAIEEILDHIFSRFCIGK